MANQDERIIIVKTPEEIRAEDLERLDNFRWIDDTFARSGLKETKEGVDTMCMAMEKERTRTVEENTLVLLLNLMRTQGWDAERAMTAMDIPASDKPLYARSVAHAISRQGAYAPATT